VTQCRYYSKAKNSVAYCRNWVVKVRHFFQFLFNRLIFVLMTGAISHSLSKRFFWMLFPDVQPTVNAHQFIFSFSLTLLFVPCGRLSWLSASFLLQVKYTLSYRIVWYRIVIVNVNVNNRFIQRKVMKHLYCSTALRSVIKKKQS